MENVLQSCQKERLGRILWANIDGVARNVMPLINAVNGDVATGVRIVAIEEWERCQERLHALYDLLLDLESRTVECSQAQIAGRLRAIIQRHDEKDATTAS